MAKRNYELEVDILVKESLDASLEKLRKLNEEKAKLGQQVSLVKDSDIASLTELLAKTEANTAATKKTKQSVDALTRARERLAKAESAEGKELSQLNLEISQQNRLNKEVATGLSKTTTAYQKLAAEFAQTKRQAQDLLASNRELTKSEQEIINKTLELDRRLKTIDKTLGDSRRFVGNYERANLGLSNSINQVTREFPAFTLSAQTGFLAISNNLPILVDEISRLSTVNKELIAKGKPVQSVFTQIAKSVFSFQTLLSIGISLLVIYGKEIGQIVSNLFNFEKALTATEEAQKRINDAQKESIKNIVEERVRVAALFAQAENANLGREAQIAAIEELRKNYPEYLKNISDEALLTGKATDSYKNLIKGIKERALNQEKLNQLEQVQLKINEEIEKRIELDDKLNKQRIRSEKLIGEFEKTTFSSLESRNIASSNITESRNQERDILRQISETEKERNRQVEIYLGIQATLTDITEKELEDRTKLVKELKEQITGSSDLIIRKERELDLLKKIEATTLELVRLRNEGAKTDQEQAKLNAVIVKQYAEQRDLLRRNEEIEKGNVRTADERRVISEKYALLVRQVNKDERDTLLVVNKGLNILERELTLLREIGTERDIAKRLEEFTNKEQRQVQERNLKSISEIEKASFDTKILQFQEELRIEQENFNNREKFVIGRLKSLKEATDIELTIENELLQEKIRLVEKETEEKKRKRQEEIDSIIKEGEELQKDLEILRGQERNAENTLAQQKLEIQIQALDQQLHEIRARGDEEALLEEEKNRKIEKLEAEHSDKVLGIRRKTSEETAKIIFQAIQKTLKVTDFVTDKIFEAENKRQQKREEALNKEASNQDKLQSLQQARAERGLQNTLEFEQKRAADIEVERQKLAKKEERRQKIQTYYNLLSSYLKDPSVKPEQAILNSLRDIAISEGITAAFAEKGGVLGSSTETTTISTKGSSRKHKSGNDILLVAEKGEGVLSVDEMNRLGGAKGFNMLRQAINSNSQEDILHPKTPILINSHAKGYDSELVREFRDLKKIIVNKPVQQTSLDNVGNTITKTFEDGKKHILKTISQKPKFRR